MPQPDINSVHIDAILTNISVAYMQNPANYIADKVFPIIPVDKKSDKYFIYDKNDWLRDEAQRRAPGTESAGGGYSLSTDTYSCDKWALHKDVDDDTKANADSPLDSFRDATNWVTSRLRIRREKQFVSDFITTGVWGTDLAGVSGTPGASQFKQWSDYSASDPITDIEDWKSDILSVTGLEANTLILGYEVMKKLKNHPDLVDRIKYTDSRTITEDMIASMFGIERVMVAKSVVATNKEGATGAYGFTVGKSALLLHVAPEPGLQVASAGYTFAWKGVSGGMGETVGIKNFRMEEIASDRIEGEIAFDNKVVGADLGIYAATVVA